MTESAKVLNERITAMQKEIAELKLEIKKLQEENTKFSQQLSAILGDYELAETDDIQEKLSDDEVLEIGIIAGASVRGKLNWISPYALCITTESEHPEEVILYKYAIAYIRKPHSSKDEHRGMYL